MAADLVCLLQAQYQLYPQLQIQDMVKLLYQNEFGPGHMVASKGDSLLRLQEEYRDMPSQRISPLFEDIGNGLCRLHLNALRDTDISLATVNNFFVYSANTIVGDRVKFQEKLAVLIDCCKKEILPFAVEEVVTWIESYRQQRYPAVGHSNVFREAYSPSYRVVMAVFRELLPLFSRLDTLLRSQERVTVAIDGPSSAGKSSLAKLLHAIYDCNIFHMDDFFLPASLKTQERLGRPGGNVHYERCSQEVVAKLSQGLPFSYRPFNCGSQSLAHEIFVSPKPLNIIEGAYSLHPTLAEAYDLKVFLKIDSNEQNQRILKRNGRELLQIFISHWIPLETHYFQALDIKEQCDLVLQF
jgi:hypothetical protein